MPSLGIGGLINGFLQNLSILNLTENIKPLQKRFNQGFAFFETPRGKKLQQFIRVGFLIAIISLLVYQISQIGWQELWAALPRTVWFYVIFLILYFTLPITEQFIYRLSLNFSFWEGFKIFTKKKVLNQEVLGYSGEAYFYIWAKQHLQESSKEILNIVKDNTIISAFASTLTAIVLLGTFFGILNTNLWEQHIINTQTFLIGGLLLFIPLFLTIRFRKSIISVDTKTAWKMFGIHELRIIWVYSLDVLQWFVVIPTVPIFIWFTFLSVKIITTRIPFLPNRELLFISASLEISKYVEVEAAAIAGILLASNILNKILNLVFFTAFSLNKQA